MHARTKIVGGVIVAAGLYWFLKSRAAAKKREMQERGRGRVGEILSSGTGTTITQKIAATENWMTRVDGVSILDPAVVVGRPARISHSNRVGIARFKARLK